MDRSELRELNERADLAAAAEGAGAAVQIVDLLPSDVQPSGLRVVLSVFRLVDGVLHEATRNYRPARELTTVIERDTRELAMKLLTATR
ncbi:MAG: hypothetical protein JO341_10445 [Gammaproteobacteria bacterium]|nr:hypothetical protein [Gammaproteobacteria bacterium]MBV9621428.1 hypothetical protein [Gammaproteobacteria bacterium]